MAYREKTVAVHGPGGVVSLQRTLVNEGREVWHIPQTLFHGPLVPFDAVLRAQERVVIHAFADRVLLQPEKVIEEFFGQKWYQRIRYDTKFAHASSVLLAQWLGHEAVLTRYGRYAIPGALR